MLYVEDKELVKENAFKPVSVIRSLFISASPMLLYKRQY